MRYLARFNLFAAFRDLGYFLKTRERHEVIAAFAALAITSYVVWALNEDSYMERAPQVVYVENWPATRTDEEIKVEITAASKAKHEAAEARRREFQKLADQLGIDTTPRRP